MTKRCWAAGAWLLVLATFMHDPARAQSPVIRDAHGTMEAVVVPGVGWCAPVVSVDLHATSRVFQRKSEDVQRFIGAIRASIDYDCPTVEIIRIHGFDRKAGVFLGYTAKASGWSIRVLSSASGILPMLAIKDSSADALREFAYFETKSQFDRAHLDDVAIDPVAAGNQIDHVTWSIDSVAGATYVVTDRRTRYRTLKEFADAAAHAAVERCVMETEGSPKNAAADAILPNVETRVFECAAAEGAGSTVAILTKEIDSVTVLFLMRSAHKSQLETMLKFIADKNIQY